MGMNSKHRNPTERRALGRKLRALVRKGKSVTEATAAHHVAARTDYYRIVEELEAWEASASFKDEIAEIRAQIQAHAGRYIAYDPYMWFLASGHMILAYTKLEPELMAWAQHNSSDDIDVLMD